MKYVECMISIPEIGDAGLEYGGASESVDALRLALTSKDDNGRETVIAFGELVDVEDLLGSLVESVDDHQCYSPAIPHLIPVGSTEDINVQMERAGFLNGEVVVILRESDFVKLSKLRDDMTRAYNCDTLMDMADSIRDTIKRFS